LLSVISNLMMGWMGTIASFLFLMGLNGFGQSSGWSGLIKNLTPWFKKKERVVVMSYWTTCYELEEWLQPLLQLIGSPTKVSCTIYRGDGHF